MSHAMAQAISHHPELQLITQELSVTTFRYVPRDLREKLPQSEIELHLDELNRKLLGYSVEVRHSSPMPWLAADICFAPALSTFIPLRRMWKQFLASLRASDVNWMLSSGMLLPEMNPSANSSVRVQSKGQSSQQPSSKCATLGSRYLKASVELGDVVLAHKAIGRLQTANAPQPQLLRQPSLPRSKVTFGTATRLPRIGGYHMHPQLAQPPAHLRQTVWIDLASSFRGKPKMATAIAAQSTEPGTTYSSAPSPQ